jgi:hypothetical protein
VAHMTMSSKFFAKISHLGDLKHDFTRNVIDQIKSKVSGYNIRKAFFVMYTI